MTFDSFLMHVFCGVFMDQKPMLGVALSNTSLTLYVCHIDIFSFLVTSA